MADVTIELLKTQLRQLRLPTMGREFEKLARDAAATKARRAPSSRSTSSRNSSAQRSRNAPGATTSMPWSRSPGIRSAGRSFCLRCGPTSSGTLRLTSSWPI